MKFEILLILIISQTIFTQDCSVVTLVGGTGAQAVTPSKDEPVCSEVVNTCCNVDDFNFMKSTYDGPTNPTTQKAIFDTYQNQVLSSIKSIVKAAGSLSKVESAIQKVKKGDSLDDFCKTASNKEIVVGVKDLVKNLKNSSTLLKKCFTSMDLLRRSVICSFCSSDNQEMFTKSEDGSFSMSFNQAQCDGLLTDCNPLISIMNDVVYPYFGQIEQLSRCGINGKKNLKQPILSKRSKTASSDLKSCVTASFKGAECSKTCSDIFRFGEQSYGIHGEADYFMTSLYQFLSKFDFDTSFFSSDEILKIKNYYKYSQDTGRKEPTDQFYYKVNQIESKIVAGTNLKFNISKLSENSNLFVLNTTEVFSTLGDGNLLTIFVVVCSNILIMIN